MLRAIILIPILCSLSMLLRAQNADEQGLVTIQVERIRVGDLLDEITQQTGWNFSYNSNILDETEEIVFNVRRASLEKTLELLCSEIELDFRLLEGQIILTSASKRQKLEKEEEYFTLSGTLSDKATGESLIGATVVVEGLSQGAISNAFGYYALQLKPGQYHLNYSYVGYQMKRIPLEIKGDQRRNMRLETSAVNLPDVIVQLPLNSIQQKNLGHQQLGTKDLQNMPEFAGESGLIKGLESLPGIKMHSNGSAFYYTRGGERDQNLIIIDDAPIYNPSHLFGFYSIVIPDFAKSIDVYKSDIPVNLGDRLSAIVDIRTKDGNLNKLEVRGAMNPLINRFSLEVPTAKGRGSIFTSLRSTNFRWLTQPTFPDGTVRFGDFNFKWNHQLDPNNRLYFTTIVSSDELSTPNVMDMERVLIPFDLLSQDSSNQNAGLRWANLAATLRWNHIFGPKLFSNTTLYSGNYVYRLDLSNNFWQSNISSLSLKSDFTHYVSNNFTSKFGAEAQGYFTDPGSVVIDTSIAVLPKIESNYSRKLVLYYNGTWKLGNRTTLNAGFRAIEWGNRGPATYFQYDDNYEVVDTVQTDKLIYHRYHNFDPRFSIQYDFSKKSNLKFSYGRYHQYLQLISNSQSPFSYFDVWLPASPNIMPQAAEQLALNYWKYIEWPGLEFSAAAYYKDFKNQIEYKEFPEILVNPALEGELRFGNMQSYGLELLLKKELGRLNGWMSYTLSRTTRQTEGINGNRPYPAFQDRPHDFSIYLNYQISKKVQFSSFYTIYSGSTFSAPTGFFTFNEQTIPIYEERNNDRLPAYSRFDFAFKFLLNKDLTKPFQHSLTFSIYNASNQKNIIAVNFNKIEDENGTPILKTNLLSESPLVPTQIELVRFFPSLTYKFKI